MVAATTRYTQRSRFTVPCVTYENNVSYNNRKLTTETGGHIQNRDVTYRSMMPHSNQGGQTQNWRSHTKKNEVTHEIEGHTQNQEVTYQKGDHILSHCIVLTYWF